MTSKIRAAATVIITIRATCSMERLQCYKN